MNCIKNCKNTTKNGEKSFYYMAPKFWNNIPLEIKKATSIDLFKFNLRKYLIQQMLW